MKRGADLLPAVVQLLAVLLLVGCWMAPEKVGVDDPRVVESLKAAESFDRMAYGFTPIPRDAKYRIEVTGGGAYDRMLHIHGRTSRTIAFRKTGDGFRWIGEQEVFTGPGTYEHPDGIFPEQIVLTYETERIAALRAGELCITYHGEDARLVRRSDLKLMDVMPILREWGYHAGGVESPSTEP